MLRIVLFFVVLLSGTQVLAQEKVRIDIAGLSNITATHPCNVTTWFGESLLDNIRRQLEVSLGTYRGIDVVEAERLRSYRPSRDAQVATVYKNRLAKNSQFSVRPSLQKFNLCQVTMNNRTSMRAAIIIQVSILNTSSGQTIDTFTAQSTADDLINGEKLNMNGVSLGSGLFKDSVMGKAMTVALTNASDGIVQRLPASASAAPAQEVDVELIKSNTP